MSRLWDRLGNIDALPDTLRQVFARAKEMDEHDRASGPFPLNSVRAGDVAPGTIVRRQDGEVAFLIQRHDRILGDVLEVCNLESGYQVKPDDLIDVILTPVELASYFVQSLMMQHACREAMLIGDATAEITAAAGGVLEEPVTDPRRQALLKEKHA